MSAAGPEFDWDGARAEFLAEARRGGGVVRLPPGVPRDWDAAAREFHDAVVRSGRAPRVGDRVHVRGREGQGRAQAVSAELAALGERWLVVATRPRAEFRAALEADAIGADVLCPWWPREVIPHGHNRGHRRRELRRRPLFPGYLFARLRGGVPPGALGFAPSVDGLVAAGERLLTMAGAAVARIAAICDARQCVDVAALPEAVRVRLAAEGCVVARRSLPEDRPPPLGAGERVTVAAGLLAGFEALVEEFSTGERVRWFDTGDLVCVSVETGGRFVRARLARSDLLKPDAP